MGLSLDDPKLKRQSAAVAIAVSFFCMFVFNSVEAQPDLIGDHLPFSSPSWEVLVKNAGIASMHTAVTHFGTVILLDRTDIGASKINLTQGRCRHDPSDLTLTVDCTAHSVLFSPRSRNIRPLYIATDTWCSSGQFVADGTLVQTGGDFDGNSKIRYFTPCPASGTCDWVETTSQSLQNGRWYSTNQLLPDGRQIIVGGRGLITTEFVPANGQLPSTLPFLEYNSYYPFVHLLPDGNLFIFSQRNSILYNYTSNIIIRTFDPIPGPEGRTYPLTGSSVMLPLVGDYSVGEILLCGGAVYGLLNPASQSCGRLVPTSNNSTWQMETMPISRTMGDMLLLPTGDVLIINGAQKGYAGWGAAADAALNPVLYQPYSAPGKRFIVLTATTIPRVYHSTANLLPDGRVMVAGSNTHQFYTFTGEFPTELRLEAFSPDYLNVTFADDKPFLLAKPKRVKYQTVFRVVVFVANSPPGSLEVNLVSSPFATHSFSQGQRLIKLAVIERSDSNDNFSVLGVAAPPSSVIAPSAYYMLFAVNNGIPSYASWVSVSN